MPHNGSPRSFNQLQCKFHYGVFLRKGAQASEPEILPSGSAMSKRWSIYYAPPGGTMSQKLPSEKQLLSSTVFLLEGRILFVKLWLYHYTPAGCHTHSPAHCPLTCSWEKHDKNGRERLPLPHGYNLAFNYQHNGDNLISNIMHYPLVLVCSLRHGSYNGRW